MTWEYELLHAPTWSASTPKPRRQASFRPTTSLSLPRAGRRKNPAHRTLTRGSRDARAAGARCRLRPLDHRRSVSAKEKPSIVAELSIFWTARAASSAITPLLDSAIVRRELVLTAGPNAEAVPASAAVHQPL